MLLSNILGTETEIKRKRLLEDVSNGTKVSHAIFHNDTLMLLPDQHYSLLNGERYVLSQRSTFQMFCYTL